MLFAVFDHNDATGLPAARQRSRGGPGSWTPARWTTRRCLRSLR